jgi:hypothetical protein
MRGWVLPVSRRLNKTIEILKHHLNNVLGSFV